MNLGRQTGFKGKLESLMANWKIWKLTTLGRAGEAGEGLRSWRGLARFILLPLALYYFGERVGRGGRALTW
jgi:hypothetical protein